MVERTAMAESSESFNSQPSAFNKLCEIVARLRAPGGCPWDREQTHESLLPALIEEAYEVAGAVRSRDIANFREGRFDIDNVLKDVTEKLIRRHPHVFGRSDARDSQAVLKQWESIKRGEKTGKHYLDGLPSALPALARAQKAQSKVARVNFDWSELDEVIAKVEEELGEIRQAIEGRHQHSANDPRAGNACHEVENEIGDLLFAVVNLARKASLDAETALQGATDKFVARFHRLEDELQARGKQLGDVDLAELDAIWDAIKEKAPNIEHPRPNAELL